MKIKKVSSKEFHNHFKANYLSNNKKKSTKKVAADTINENLTTLDSGQTSIILSPSQIK